MNITYATLVIHGLSTCNVLFHYNVQVIKVELVDSAPNDSDRHNDALRQTKKCNLKGEEELTSDQLCTTFLVTPISRISAHQIKAKMLRSRKKDSKYVFQLKSKTYK